MTVIYAPENSQNYANRLAFWKMIEDYHCNDHGQWRRSDKMPDWLVVEFAMQANIEVGWAYRWARDNLHMHE